jgi:hypothetical protein
VVHIRADLSRCLITLTLTYHDVIEQLLPLLPMLCEVLTKKGLGEEILLSVITILGNIGLDNKQCLESLRRTPVLQGLEHVLSHDSSLIAPTLFGAILWLLSLVVTELDCVSSAKFLSGE